MEETLEGGRGPPRALAPLEEEEEEDLIPSSFSTQLCIINDIILHMMRKEVVVAWLLICPRILLESLEETKKKRQCSWSPV